MCVYVLVYVLITCVDVTYGYMDTWMYMGRHEHNASLSHLNNI